MNWCVCVLSMFLWIGLNVNDVNFVFVLLCDSSLVFIVMIYGSVCSLVYVKCGVLIVWWMKW